MLFPERGGGHVRPSVVEETVVGLVEDEATVSSLAPLDDALELSPLDDRARRVVRRVQDDAARPLRRALREVRGDRLPMGLDFRRHVKRRGAGKPDHFGKRDPVRTEERDLVLRLEEDLTGVEDGLLGAGRDEDVLARQGDVAVGVFQPLEKDVDLVARLDGHGAAVVGDFTDGEEALGLITDVNDHFEIVDLVRAVLLG